MFSGIINNWKKSEAAVVVENLLQNHYNNGLLSEEPKSLANTIVGNAWDTIPDVFSGKFGQRPHKISIAAYSLAHTLEQLVKDSGRESVMYPVAWSLMTIINEVAANGSWYPLNSADQRLLEHSMAVADETGRKVAEAEQG